jgi:hypothetical protein
MLKIDKTRFKASIHHFSYRLANGDLDFAQ